jgi:hypothetical protein
VLCAKLASIPLVFDASLDMPFTVSKALLSHGLAWILAGVIAGLLIQFGGSLLRWSWLHVPVSAFLAVNVVATLFAADVGLALFGTHARMLGLASIADGVVLYVALVVLVRGRADASALAISALGAAAIVLVYEAVQMLGRDPFRWSGDTIARPISTLGQSTVLAQYLTTLGIGALACGLLIDRVRVSIRVLLIAYSALLVLGSVTDTLAWPVSSLPLHPLWS